MAGFFSRLKEGLNKTRDNIVAGIDAVFYGARRWTTTEI